MRVPEQIKSLVGEHHTGCWLPVGAGRVRHAGRRVSLSVLAWELVNGDKPVNYTSLQPVCGNKDCVNPSHARGCIEFYRQQRAKQFWLLVKKSGGCWEWQGACTEAGYGLFRWSGRLTLCHRLSWTMKHDWQEPDQHVLHDCDNPCCVRPSHLFLGTDADNSLDMAKKDRHGLAKLSVAVIPSIRQRSAAGESFASISRDLGVSDETIANVVQRKTWKHVK